MRDLGSRPVTTAKRLTSRADRRLRGLAPAGPVPTPPGDARGGYISWAWSTRRGPAGHASTWSDTSTFRVSQRYVKLKPGNMAMTLPLLCLYQLSQPPDSQTVPTMAAWIFAV